MRIFKALADLVYRCRRSSCCRCAALACLARGFGGISQSRQFERWRLCLDRQAEPVAAHGSLHLRKQIDARFGIRIPQLAGMPWNRTLTATGQTNAAGAQIGAAAGIIKKMKQRYIPAAVYITTLIEFDKKEHRADDLQTLIDLS